MCSQSDSTVNNQTEPGFPVSLLLLVPQQDTGDVKRRGPGEQAVDAGHVGPR
jgi:hypothetical protein